MTELNNKPGSLINSQTEPSDWCNSNNKAFYEEISIAGLEKLSIKAGLSNGCDIKELKPYWIDANSILDVGAGYGRAIDSLIANGFQGNITAIERDPLFFASLKEKYQHNPQVNLLNVDLNYFDSFNIKFDIVMMLWSGIADFTSSEQADVVKLFSKLKSEQGIIVIDTLSMNTMPLQAHQSENTQTFITKASEDVIIKTYQPTAHEIEQYAHSCGLKNIKVMTYTTDSNRTRLLYVIS